MNQTITIVKLSLGYPKINFKKQENELVEADEMLLKRDHSVEEWPVVVEFLETEPNATLVFQQDDTNYVWQTPDGETLAINIF